MDKQILTKRIELARKGDRKALEQLLIYAHTSVSWMCLRLVNDQHISREMTQRILKALTNQIDKIENADHFQKWLGNITATRCMRMREHLTVQEFVPDSQDMSFPSNELSKEETAQVAQILADALPENHRICIILSACCGIGIKSIAQLTGIPEEEVSKRIAEAEVGIREQMQIYQMQGVVYSGPLAVSVLLRYAMQNNPNRSAAASMIQNILPPIPAAPVQQTKRSNNLIKILLCSAIALVLLLLLMICGIFMKSRTKRAEETVSPSTTVSVTAALETTEEITEETSEATSEVTTEPTTQPTTEETTVPETTEEEETVETTEVPETTVPKQPYTPPASTGGNSGSGTPKPTTDPNYNPGQGEDGHTHDFFTVPAGQNATCTKAGKIHRLCRICQHGVTVDDPDNPPLGHNYQVNIVVPPTTTSQGYTNYKCTRCGKSYDDDFIPPLPAPETQPPETETQAPPPAETQAPPVEDNQAPITETQGPESDLQPVS